MRVIAGSARGRALVAPKSERTRPTGDKVKGAIFSMLEAEAFKRGFTQEVDERRERFAAAVAWPHSLDLFAGSGALGIEALSRGAAQCDFVEHDAEARSVLQRNLERTGLAHRARVHATRARPDLASLGGPFDVVFADPPYADEDARHVLRELGTSRLVAEAGVVVWEHAWDTPAPPTLGRLRLLRTRRHGRAAVSLYAAPGAQTEDADGPHPGPLPAGEGNGPHPDPLPEGEGA